MHEKFFEKHTLMVGGRVLRLAFVLMVDVAMASVPRIKPITLAAAHATVYSWTTRSPHHAKSLSLYSSDHATAFSSLGAVAVYFEGEICAVALVKRLDSRDVELCDISCRDFHSGTALMKGLVATMPQRLRLGRTLDARWHIAHSYFKF